CAAGKGYDNDAYFDYW
nr:immunoglobulin heavy chain junction region [Mus musculus]